MTDRQRDGEKGLGSHTAIICKNATNLNIQVSRGSAATRFRCGG